MAGLGYGVFSVNRDASRPTNYLARARNRIERQKVKIYQDSNSSDPTSHVSDSHTRASEVITDAVDSGRPSKRRKTRQEAEVPEDLNSNDLLSRLPNSPPPPRQPLRNIINTINNQSVLNSVNDQSISRKWRTIQPAAPKIDEARPDSDKPNKRINPAPKPSRRRNPPPSSPHT